MTIEYNVDWYGPFSYHGVSLLSEDDCLYRNGVYFIRSVPYGCHVNKKLYIGKTTQPYILRFNQHIYNQDNFSYILNGNNYTDMIFLGKVYHTNENYSDDNIFISEVESLLIRCATIVAEQEVTMEKNIYRSFYGNFTLSSNFYKIDREKWQRNVDSVRLITSILPKTMTFMHWC